MNVFLINPPFYFLGGLEFLTQNLGLGYLAATLLADGHKVEVLDALAEGMDRSEQVTIGARKPFRFGLSFEEIADRIPAGVDLIGITAAFSNHATIIEGLSAAIRKRFPNIPIVLGGVYASTQPERALESAIDYVVVGEGENPMRELAAGKKPEDIKGVWFRRDGHIVDGGCSEMIPDLDSIPFPARELFPMDKYFKLSPRGRPDNNTATLMTSRGCPFDCTFCSIHPVYQRKWRARSAENVLAEIDELIEKWGVTEIEFEDDNLTLNIERAKAIFEGLIGKNIRWSCPNGLRVDALDAELLDLMRRSGCTAVHLAIESGDPEMLAAMNKKLNLGKVDELIRVCNKLNIPFVGFFIVGHPGETEKRFRKTMRFAKRLINKGMIACGVHIATPYPGTRLFQKAKEKGYLIHEDTDRRLMFPGDIHIVTPDFSKEKVIERVYRMEVATGVLPDFTSGFNGFLRWKIRPKFSKIGIDRRKYIAHLNDDQIENFYPIEYWFREIPFRWSKGDAALKVKVPRRTKKLGIFAKSNRAHSVQVYLDDVLLGDLAMDNRWAIYYLNLPENHSAGNASLRFGSDVMVPADLGFSRDSRTLGFILGWYEFI